MTASQNQSASKGLAATIGKCSDFELAEQEAYLNLLRTFSDLSSDFDKLFREHGISQPQYNVLRILRGHRGRAIADQTPERGLPTQRISEDMITREPDMTRLVDRLEKAGLVERVRCATDRRVVYVRITDMGLKLVDTLDQPVMKLHHAQLGHMTEAQLRQLIALLEAARERPDTQ